MKKIVIVGATSAIAQHCARIWAKDPVLLCLVGRDAEKLELVALDLRVRSPRAQVAIEVLDFEDIAAISQLAQRLDAQIGGVDIVLIAHGFLPDQLKCECDIAEAEKGMRINALSPALIAEAFVTKMVERNTGILAVIGSVAGDRGRKSNYFYGAAKSLIATYIEGLQHRLARTGVSAVLIKPGPTDTPMTAHLKGGSLKLAAVESVAREIVQGVGRRSAVVYTPAKWRLIMSVIRLLPRSIFNRMDI